VPVVYSQVMQVSPTVLVIFGATGDLTHKKLMPALYTLYREKYLSGDSQIIGFARRPYTDEAFQEEMAQAVRRHATIKDFESSTWKRFARTISYQQGTFEDRSAYKALRQTLDAFDEKMKACCNKIFYLATPPHYYPQILDHLKSTGLSKGCGEQIGPARNVSSHRDAGGWTRIVIEKPFGKDLATAQALDNRLAEHFDERQIYRIDHYLGKETIQNILALRFANGIFEPIWNNTYVDHVQITLAERPGVGRRAMFYEGVGALRDVAQNHLLMLMALVGMEQPQRFLSEPVRDARAAFIKEIVCLTGDDVANHVIRGQYGKGVVNGETVPGYQEEEGVAKDSLTETFVAMRVMVDNARWKGVPFYLRTGKRLPRRAVEVSLIFRQTCHTLFKDVGCPEEGNVLTIRLSPEEGFGLRLITKRPGHAFKLESMDADLLYRSPRKKEIVHSYVRLLLDVFRGDQMLFNRSDELQSSWQFITNILKSWEKEPKPAFPNYSAGTWGPDKARTLIEQDKRAWILG